MKKNFLRKIFGLDDKIVLVVGGGGELGKTMAIGLAEAGADVAIADLNFKSTKDVAKKIEDIGKRSLALNVDVTNSKSVNSMTEKVINSFGRIDILINSAGVSVHIPAQRIADEEWNRVIRINLTGTFYCCRAIGIHMIARNKGNIVNIASMSGTITNKDCFNAPYCASKGGVKMLTKQLAEQWAKYNIRVNSISPGYMRTPLSIPIIDKPNFKEFLESVSPMKRAGMPEELIGLAIYLASDASSFLTGEDIIIDGGYTIV